MSLNSNYSSNEHEKLSWLYENTLNERRFRTSEVFPYWLQVARLWLWLCVELSEFRIAALAQPDPAIH
jgi:hypothetical protein